MLGAFGVGKTSLVDRLVRNTFSQHPRVAVGVRIDKCMVELEGRRMNMIVWDLHSEEDFRQILKSYLRGAAGYLLVVDGTRPPSLDGAFEIMGLTETSSRDTPCVLLLNKADLAEDWRLEPSRLDELERRGLTVLKTSARTGEGVTEAFTTLGRAILGRAEQ
ncbi:MAG: GTP-binding protein [candidate division WOR-3 bacterium]|nr:MAG: GTP-binding protein [candidate division WOR-3 bacterium]